MNEQPNLGFATTRELLEELEARSRIHGESDTMDADLKNDMVIYLNQCSDEFLNYRTVDES